ncbi:hypothetical protein C8Q76DRAFT_11730 [Earliella scabrosa]|nr:hypothetical protein C8Q76DRAFT_11730 [Earliella scabrosa]
MSCVWYYVALQDSQAVILPPLGCPGVCCDPLCFNPRSSRNIRCYYLCMAAAIGMSRGWLRSFVF